MKQKPEPRRLEQPSDGLQRIGLGVRLQQIEKATTMHAQSFLVRRWSNLKQVRRAAAGWLLAAVVLIGIGWWQIMAQRSTFSHEGPVEGGAYIEGDVGNVNTLNPIFATNVAEKSLSGLLFAGLLRTDDRGNAAADLAETWAVDDDGKEYTITLRPDLKWSDGRPITTKDVVFTIDAIQSPLSRSPLLSAWRNVQVEAKDERTVTFKLNAPYAPFLKTLTLGILPEHALANVSPEQLGNTTFNSQPRVTSGPFVFRGIVKGREEVQAQTDVYLTKNSRYHLGQPKLDRFTMRVYEDREALVNAMRNREIMAANDVPANAVDYFKTQSDLKVTERQLFNGIFAFFKTTTPPFDDPEVRKAFAFGTDISQITSSVGDVEPLQGPLLRGQSGYKEKNRQNTNNLQLGQQTLAKAGWKRGQDGIRVKKGQRLSVQLVTLNSGEFGRVAQTLQEQWEQLGAEVNVELVEQNNFQQNVLTPHAYDALVYQLAIGRDSDTYAFWHSSQADQGLLNLSEYSSEATDQALESGRTLLDPRLRDVKYESFVKQWIKDVPAIALFRPNLYYVQLKDSNSITAGDLGEAQERFNNVQYWTAETGRLYDTR